jgi:hypothetical protein
MTSPGPLPVPAFRKIAHDLTLENPGILSELPDLRGIPEELLLRGERHAAAAWHDDLKVLAAHRCDFVVSA